MLLRMGLLAEQPHLTPADRSNLIMALGILLGLVIVGFVVILLVRRKVRSNEADSSGSVNTGFSLADLRDMVARGELTQEEYDRTRQRIISKVKGASQQPPSSRGT